MGPDLAASLLCAHCALPAAAGDAYCCFGCELAARIGREANEDHGRIFGTLNFALVLSMLVMMLALFLYAEDVYDASGDREMAWLRTIYRIASLVLATPVMVLAGLPLVSRAIARLRSGRGSMEALIATGAFAAYGLSLWSVLVGRTAIYLDSATAALVLATLGRYLEVEARSRASQLLASSLERARREVVVVEADGSTHEIAPSSVCAGMTVLVPVDRVVPVDLRLDVGPCEIDLGVISGESSPVEVDAGATVPAGAVPISDGLRGTALRSARDSTLERLAQLARSLGERRSKLMATADLFAAALTPVVCAVAAGTFLFWTLHTGVERGVLAALAVVLVACPCSYAIATPMVHWLALRRALAAGVLIRSAGALEALARVRHVAFDKTGTITDSEMKADVHQLGEGVSEEEALGLVRALTEDSTHPVSRALFRCAKEARSAKLEARRFVPGQGVVARDEAGRRLMIGRDRAPASALECAAVLSRDERILARFTVHEHVRPSAAAAMRLLAKDGIDPHLLTGDHRVRAERIAAPLGIPIQAELTPQQKIAALDALGSDTAMVGDGINDAPALAGASMSFAIAGATDLARGLAQVTLLEPDLTLVPWTLALARRAKQMVVRLLGLSTAYNLVFVILAASGALRPVFAGLSMLLSSLLTLGFAMSIGRESNREEQAA